MLSEFRLTPGQQKTLRRAFERENAVDTFEDTLLDIMDVISGWGASSKYSDKDKLKLIQGLCQNAREKIKAVPLERLE